MGQLEIALLNGFPVRRTMRKLAELIDEAGELFHIARVDTLLVAMS
ncbi:hypothetical protein AXXA_29750 [Achromobacter insuavis AXX-A]|uniref:Uncharacterized protein n=1 Tax=Achromobacter insuavis AXX-A TaxID=1003200 RepID=F7TAF0_9BURK|nr:hypothetical protein AXXA_29750 [Achromobacter insuavis AXX-A]